MKQPWHLRPFQAGDEAEWLRMRQALWSDFKQENLQREMVEILADPQQAVFVLQRTGTGLGGFIEISLRPWADGCDTHPVGYIEAWYVDSDLRRHGAGSTLVKAGESWARAQGCTEMASDCELENSVSFQAHLALGYEEVIRIIQFRKTLAA
jgi:aminoglycoside 6'-N-acetyltransferase I